MLNELYQFAQTLQGLGLLPDASTHPEVGRAAKCECLLIRLDVSGAPTNLRLVVPGKEENPPSSGDTARATS